MGLFSSLGGILGTVGGAFLGGPVGALVGAGIGGSAGGAVDSNRANKKQEGYFNQQMAFANSQDQFQRDYVRNAIQWRIEDAKQAGVHPMAALGFQSPSYSPVSTPSAPSYMDSSNFDTGSTFGQTFNNAVFAAKIQQQQLEAGHLSNRGLELQNQHMELTNLQLASDLQRASMTTKAKPDVNGQGSLGVIGGQQDAIPSESSSRNTFGNSTYNLYSLASFGDMVITALNPDIADSLTESQVAHLTATLTRDIEYYRNPQIKMDAFKHLTKAQQQAVVDGRAVFEYIPAAGGFMLTYPQKRNRDGSISGKLRFE